MAVVTPWGYTISADSLGPIVSVAEFNVMTGGAFVDSDAVESRLAAVSAAVRGFCGWHVAPSLSCTYVTGGGGSVIELPAMAVSSVDSVIEGGVELTDDDYEWRSDGLVRRKPPHKWPCGWRSVEVAYTAGHDLAVVPDLAAVVCQIASNALAAAPGVRREQAGSVSIEYNQTGSGVTGGVALLERDMALLGPYRLPAAPR